MKGTDVGPGGRLRRRADIHPENKKVQRPRITRQALVDRTGEIRGRVGILNFEWRGGIERRTSEQAHLKSEREKEGRDLPVGRKRSRGGKKGVKGLGLMSWRVI